MSGTYTEEITVDENSATKIIIRGQQKMDVTLDVTLSAWSVSLPISRKRLAQLLRYSDEKDVLTITPGDEQTWEGALLVNKGQLEDFLIKSRKAFGLPF